MAAKKHPIFDTATTLGKIVAFLGVSSICGVLVAGLMVPAVALAGVVLLALAAKGALTIRRASAKRPRRP